MEAMINVRSRLYAAIFAAALAIAIVVQTQTGSAQVSTQPNFVVIMVDDLDVGSMQTLLDKGMMPNVKTHLVDRGYTFTESYVTNSLCCPSRATFLTGQYSHNHGVRGNFPPLGGVTLLNEERALPVWMKLAGYHTGYVGKYLNGYGTLTGPYVPAGWDDWAAVLDPGTYSMYQYMLNLNGAVIDVGALTRAFGELPALYQTDVLTYLAGEAITRAAQSGRPFFLYLNPLAPHIELFPVYNECSVAGSTSPFGGNFWGVSVRPAPRHKGTIAGDEVDFPLPLPPSFNEADMTDKPDWQQANPPLTADDIGCLKKAYWGRLESMRAVDDMVGYVFDTLQKTGALENTIVMFTSDNGFLLGEHRLTQKLVAYNEAIRVPLYIRTPSNQTRQTIATVVLNNDLAPTIADYGSGVKLVTIDGRSLRPLLQNPNLTPWRTAFLVEHWNDLVAFGPLTLPPDYAAIRTVGASARILARYPTVSTGIRGELYDVGADPFEMNNLFLSRPAEVSFIDPWLTGLKTCRGVVCSYYESNFPQ
jgi:arylsulfatase A-like enzyme